MGLAEDGEWGFLRPKEKVLPPARKDSGWLAGMGGAGILWVSWGFGSGFSSKGMSVEDGKVDEELNRAEEDELSCPPLDEELFVPPLPLPGISTLSSGGALTTYRLLKFG